jgi:hypothetical protein
MAFKHSSVEAGEQYRDSLPGLFGALGIVWVVQDVFTGSDGMIYARLASAADTSQRKTLSVAVLGDRRRFVRVEK